MAFPAAAHANVSGRPGTPREVPGQRGRDPAGLRFHTRATPSPVPSPPGRRPAKGDVPEDSSRSAGLISAQLPACKTRTSRRCRAMPLRADSGCGLERMRAFSPQPERRVTSGPGDQRSKGRPGVHAVAGPGRRGGAKAGRWGQGREAGPGP